MKNVNVLVKVQYDEYTPAEPYYLVVKVPETETPHEYTNKILRAEFVMNNFKAEEYDTYEEYSKEYGTDITEEEFNIMSASYDGKNENTFCMYIENMYDGYECVFFDPEIQVDID